MQWTRVLAAALVYSTIVFAVGFMLGPIRVFWIESWLGTTTATLCEAPFLLGSMAIAARLVPTKLGLTRNAGTLARTGIAALAFQQAADLAVGVLLRGIAPVEQLANLATPAGLIYLVLLMLFATMPILMNRARVPA